VSLSGSLKNHKTKKVRRKPVVTSAVGIDKNKRIIDVVNKIPANLQPSG
jgi:hypothetical protein